MSSQYSGSLIGTAIPLFHQTPVVAVAFPSATNGNLPRVRSMYILSDISVPLIMTLGAAEVRIPANTSLGADFFERFKLDQAPTFRLATSTAPLSTEAIAVLLIGE